MLVNFRVENFKSFKDFTEFSMEATKLKNLPENTFKKHNISLLKSAVIYGANASGKSNLKIAMETMQAIIKDSINTEKMNKYPHAPFLLDSQTEKEASIFEMEFIIEEILYRYGFSISTKGVIYKEWLHQKNLLAKIKRENLLFRREEDTFHLGTLFKEGKLLEDKTRPNALFLSVVAQFNGAIATKILEWFSQVNILSNIRSREFEEYSFQMLEDEGFKEKIVSFIKSADIGIYDIEKKKLSLDDLELSKEELNVIPEEVIKDIQENGLSTINTLHTQYDKEKKFTKLKTFKLTVESEGTQKLLALSAPILDTLLGGKTLIIDELDNSLHTELVRAIIQLFNSKETNPNNAQLIFTTHDTNLMNQKIFRRDQIWFTQKDIYGASELYSLIEYGKGKTRDDLALEKNYLEGKFGAKPHIGSLAFEVE
jgi:AAA15 family ATPase/GTPase